MIIVEYKNGQKEAVLGETDRDWELMNRQGKIYATMPNGHGKIIYREDVRAVELFPKVEWDKGIEEHKTKKEAEEREQKAAKELREKNAAEAKARADQTAADLAAQKRANVAWRRKFVLVRLFTRKPFPEVK